MEGVRNRREQKFRPRPCFNVSEDLTCRGYCSGTAAQPGMRKLARFDLVSCRLWMSDTIVVMVAMIRPVMRKAVVDAAMQRSGLRL